MLTLLQNIYTTRESFQTWQNKCWALIIQMVRAFGMSPKVRGSSPPQVKTFSVSKTWKYPLTMMSPKHSMASHKTAVTRSIANALVLLQSCTKLSKCSLISLTSLFQMNDTILRGTYWVISISVVNIDEKVLSWRQRFVRGLDQGIKTLRLRQYSRHFAHDAFKHIFLKKMSEFRL